jgi:hypothetical protein
MTTNRLRGTACRTGLLNTERTTMRRRTGREQSGGDDLDGHPHKSKTNFLAPTRCGTVKAHSHPLHIGTRTIVVETEVRGDNGKLAAKLLQTQAIL